MAGEHPELDALRDVFGNAEEIGRRIRVEVARPLHPANQRLAEYLGAEVVVVTATAAETVVSAHEALTTRSCIAYGCTLDADPGVTFCSEHRKRREPGSVSPLRLQLAAEVRRLRDSERLQYDWIAKRLGISRSYANDLYSDPDGSRSRARKASYRGVCVDCGGPTTGSEGPAKTATRCARCEALRAHADRYWTREVIIERFRQFAARNGRGPTSTDAHIYAPSIRANLSPERIAEGEYAVSQAPLPPHWVVVREFESWPLALQAAGLDANPLGGAAHRNPARGATLARIYHVLHRNGDGGLHDQTVEAHSAENAIEQVADREGEWIAVLDSAWFSAPVEPRSVFSVVKPAA